ncbi:MAG: BrnA antitoxin family protein [Spirochaetaceae bacterium]|jgi:uncharacterized protein (DUF4415 family)|nr:BrnA antitoxin family protein [Spirochaetaceae bacterium]
MEKTVYHKMPKKISKKGLKQLESLRQMNDDVIDYSDAPPLNKKQLDEVARIVRERKERMPSITLRLPSPILEKYKELGKGYTSVMAHVLCEYIQEHSQM